MKTIPADSSARAITSCDTSMRTPRASRTSALPEREVNERLPCLAILAPAPAATKAAAVEMLNVVTAPPPVPQVSTRPSGSEAGSRTIASRNARAAPATSSACSPFTRSAVRSEATWAALASPRITSPKAAADSDSERVPPCASDLMAAAMDSADTERLQEPLGKPGVDRDQ